ncbi:MAG: extracellular solute-binding protein [Candidatus Hydrogenedentes bacterium]|nr:extracellular solute-binding protein [Candidatus Hydrogenedentota bacterium]
MKGLLWRIGIAIALAGLTAGCGAPASSPAATTETSAPFAPLNSGAALFWDRQTTESAALMRALADEFNAGHAGLPIQVEHVGGYGEIFRKVSASIQARSLPAMVVSYESMTAQYAVSGAVRPLDDLVSDPATGLSGEDLADFFPAVLETNRFEDHKSALLSFPFTKSVLMLYYNTRVLAEAGVAGPPQTWAAFLEAARTIKAKTGKKAYAISVDCSTLSAMIFSHGGEVMKEHVLQYDRPAAIAVFELLEHLAREELAYAIPPNTFDDEVALSNDQVAFTLRTSAGSAPLALAMGNDATRWGMTRIPQADPDHPATILFGPNVTLFRVGQEQEAAAWNFVKFFTRKDTMIRWATQTGYLPVRQSVAGDPVMEAYWAGQPGNRTAFDCLSIARSEPNVAGWQQVRDLVERAASAVIGKLMSGREAALDLQQKATAALAEY